MVSNLTDREYVLCVPVLQAQAAPPLDQYNELLRICEMHSDLASVHKVRSCSRSMRLSSSY
jgi:hypothetical protein